ncbi:MAG: EAL domain-containing protein [Sedimenticola sp.]
MTSRQRLIVLIAVMAMVGLTAVALSLWILYRAAFEEERTRLIEIVQSQARLIEAVARFDATHSQDANPRGAAAATLDQIIDAHEHYQGFGETGEFTLAKRENEEIVFLLSFRHQNPELQRRLPMPGVLAEPMRRALEGKSGTVIGQDYRGVMVLAAHEPVAVLNVGIVAKIDLDEVQKPFIKAGALSLGGGIMIILLGVALFYYFGSPLVQRLELRVNKRTKELSESKKSLSEAQRIAQLGNWDLDLETNKLHWSDEIYRIFGLEPNQFDASYEAFLNAIHPDDRDYVNKAYTESVKNREPYDIEHRLLLEDGTLKYVKERCETFYADDGTPLRSIGTIQDITEKKESEEKLHQAAAMFENTSEGVLVTDTQGNILAVNKAFTEISGFSEDEVLGKNPRLWKSEHHDRSFYQTMWASLNQAGYWRGEIWNRHKNGEVYPCWQTITAVKGKSGNILHYVSLMSDISAIKESQAQLEHLAHHDPLTNLPNRLLFNARLTHALERARRNGSGVGVMFLDLDNFKPINDGLGHPVGDKVLQAVAERLSTQVRENDTVARLGGDEFAILLEETSEAEASAHLAGKILSAFDAHYLIEGQELYLTTTIGISLYPMDGKDVTTLLKNADAAMYQAKEQGKNRYCFYTQDLTKAALERLQLENDLRVALNRSEFSVYYQPQYSLVTGRLEGAEALVRWQHPERGLISPDKFIPIAESTGGIIPLGEWVLREACARIKALQDLGHDTLRIGVNVAGQQIQHGGFVKTVAKVLEETGLDPQCLELEVTESFIMRQADRAIETLEELRALGVTLAIDDFGTGYSSLSYLKRLPINKLKVDRSFVMDIPQDINDMAITRAVIALGKSLQLAVIAEGVETQEQQDFLKKEGCDEAQGYYYSRPVPEQEFTKLLLDLRPLERDT